MKIIAYYLPQFHEIPENNKWWGEGFTEWVNMKKARPLFEGHNQPRVPLNANYYDLSDVEVMRWQVELAKKYGLYGFCFYHYWFDGHLLLEKPVEQYLSEQSIDFPFCICWANEHWTNAWVSKDNKVLIEQRYGSEKEWTEHFYYLLPFLKDKRYIKIDGKPLLVLYRPEIIDCLEDMLNCWRSLARKEGLGEICIAFQHPSYYVYPKKREDLFDYCLEYQPTFARTMANNHKHSFLRRMKRSTALWFEKNLKIDLRYNPRHDVAKVDYDKVWKDILRLRPHSGKSVPGAFVDWDNTPRRGKTGSAYTGVTPEKFKKYLGEQIRNARDNYHKDFMFLFAWNEWAEGGYMEPDEKNGYGMLEAMRGALKENNELPLA